MLILPKRFSWAERIKIDSLVEIQTPKKKQQPKLPSHIIAVLCYCLYYKVELIGTR